MNVLFLDYDGVVNIPMWSEHKTRGWARRFNMPYDNKVNHLEAVQWVSEFCEKYNYDIVVTSTWRLEANYKECLINAGLRDGIQILGCTPILKELSAQRGEEISLWLDEHPEVKNYLIFDDESDMTVHMERLIKVDNLIGFTEKDYHFAVTLHNMLNT